MEFQKTLGCIHITFWPAVFSDGFQKEQPNPRGLNALKLIFFI